VESWNYGIMGKTSISQSKPNIPIFQYSILPRISPVLHYSGT
jgi:hypothetical protein